MVKAGAPTDAVIDELVPLLEAGDIIVDGGNAHFEDTRRREAALREHGIHFVGAGISGGEEGALQGPVDHAGRLRRVLRRPRAAARVDLRQRRRRAVLRLHGPRRRRPLRQDGPQRHRVRRHAVHRRGLRPAPRRPASTPAEIADVFAEWNTRRPGLVPHRDHRRGAATRSTPPPARRWSTSSSTRPSRRAPAGGPSRSRSSWASPSTPSPRRSSPGPPPGTSTCARRPAPLTGPDDRVGAEDVDQLVDDVRAALWASKVVAYAQGLDMIRQASQTYDWGVDVAEVAGSGAAGASSARGSWTASARRKRGRSSRRCWSTRTSPRSWAAPGSWRRVVAGAATTRRARSRASRPRCRTTTRSAASGCRPRWCRVCATSSARTPTSASTATASSTPSGPATAPSPAADPPSLDVSLHQG